MTEQSNEPQPQKRLPDDGLKDSFITMRVNSQVKADLKAKADACGMHLGEYILSLCIGYEPKAVMTAEQEKLLEPLIGIRTDIQNISNALNSVPKAARTILFGNEKFMLQWKTDIDEERAALTDIIKSYTKPNTL